MTDLDPETGRYYASQVGSVRRVLNEHEFGLLSAYDLPGRLRTFVGKGVDKGISRRDGLSATEGLAADHLIEAVRAFGVLPVQHPDEIREFVDAIHRAQNVLAVRIARRCYPHGWPTHDRAG